MKEKTARTECRHCGESLGHAFLDLKNAPPSNNYLRPEQLNEPEVYYPLRVFVCKKCWLVQIDDHRIPTDLFSPEYAYFSGVSKTWVAHTKNYAEDMSQRMSLTKHSFVVELASNDGTLLKHFNEKGIRILGIEPTDSTASAAERNGVPTVKKFFNTETADYVTALYGQADLICANNVYAHVPDINGFTKGIKKLLSSEGLVTVEFPHLLNTINHIQFDTIYHEHYSYLSLIAVNAIFESQGLRIFDVEEVSTHGGSLRVFGCHVEDERETKNSVIDLINKEINYGLNSDATYARYQKSVDKIKNEFLTFLIEQKSKNKVVIGYGAAAKGNTILNYCGITKDLISVICDAAPSKQEKYTPGSHIPIVHPKFIKEMRPDWIVIFPWNIAEEIKYQEQEVYSWGGRFLTVIPTLQIQ